MGYYLYYEYEFKGTKDQLFDILKKIRKEINSLKLLLNTIETSKIQWYDVNNEKYFGFFVKVSEHCESFYVYLKNVKNNKWIGKNSTKISICTKFQDLYFKMIEVCETHKIVKSVLNEFEIIK